MRKTFFVILAFVFGLSACVGPAQPTDGLIDNYPAVVNTTSSFSYTLNGNYYDFNDSYTLNLDAKVNESLVITLVTGEITSVKTDTSELRLYRSDNDSTIYHSYLMDKQVVNRTIVMDSTLSALPDRAELVGKNFSGRIDFIIAVAATP